MLLQKRSIVNYQQNSVVRIPLRCSLSVIIKSMNNYTKEQVEDITKREKAALEYLKENGLTPAAQIQKVNLGNDIFADKLVPFLQDLKFATKKEEAEIPSNDPEVNPNVETA